MTSEISTLYYAFFTWRQRPAEDERALTVYRRSGWGSILACILVLIAAESIGIHLLIQMKSVYAAWIVTGLDIYGAIWLLGDYQALRLRPSIIGTDVFLMRHGLRWQAEIPRSEVIAIVRVTSEAEWKRKDVLKLALLDDPTHLVVLREPIEVRGLAGITKTIRAIAVLPDDPQKFVSAFES